MGFFDGKTLPVLTVILNHFDSVPRILELIREGISEGAEAFCIQFEKLPAEDRTPERYREILEACEGRPVYACVYNRHNTMIQTDEDIEKELLLLADLGAELIDVRTDMYCPSEFEITKDPVAVEKQKELIAKLHARGSEVLMSSHVHHYMEPQEVIDLMQMQKDRGADVWKVVAKADTDEELCDAYITTARIHKEVGAKHLFLIGGEKLADHRLLAGEMGDCIELCTVDSRPDLQPPISAVKKLKEMMAEFRETQELLKS